ncbi:MAG TPA: Clp protease N-terminal domain-containing protein [Ktedonobacterales bacterium]|nr:Clp protease N-terminal domain-containing protein [Ktedonobacterales bacterium]
MNRSRRRRGHLARRGSTRLYRTLLWLYPPSLRRAHGDEMLQLFRDTLRDEIARHGPPGMLRVWSATVADLVTSLPREWPRELHHMRTRARRAAIVRHTQGYGQIATTGAIWGRGGPRLTMNDKFEKFTERARKVMSLAQEEAQRFNHNYIGTEHILLGLVREGDGVAAKVLMSLGVELEKVRNAVETIIGRGDRVVLGDIGLTPRAKKVIELAIDEARRLNHHYIGTEHLLLGLIREGEGIAAGVLESLGVNLERVRLATIDVLNPSGQAAARSGRVSRPGLNQSFVQPQIRRPTLGMLTLLCQNVEATSQFYIHNFAAETVSGAIIEDTTISVLRLPGGGPTLELRQASAQTEPAAASSVELNIWVDDVALVWRTLQDSAVAGVNTVTESQHGRSFTVPDPDRRVVRVIASGVS